MNFSESLDRLKAGDRIARSGWNGKNMYLVLVPAETWSVYGSSGRRISEDVQRLLPWIGMRTMDGGFVPWLASQTDILAEDWVLFPVA